MMNKSDNDTNQLMTSFDLLNDMNAAESQRLIPTALFLGIIAVLGILGNALVIHIYRTRYKLSNAKIFIVSVSAVDMFSCCIAIPFEIILLMDQFTFEQAWMCKSSRFFNTLSTCASSFILFFVAVDRFRKVCRPFQRQITTSFATKLCIVSVALGVVVALPAFWMYGKKTFVVKQDTIDEAVIGSECSTADAMKGSIFPLINIAMQSVLFVTGIVAISVLYCLIGCKIKKQSKKMRLMMVRSMSIPMTPSSCVENGVDIPGEIDPGRHNHEDVISRKNNDNKKQNERKKRKSEKSTDESWTRDTEVSYTSYEKEEHAEVNRGKTKQTDKQTKVSDDQNVTPKDTNYNYEQSERVKTIESTGSSERVNENKGTGTLKRQLSNAGSQIFHVIRRITSHTSDEKLDSARKSQCLKEVRARKTAFIMFLISLAFILSYLPHLILMATRVVKYQFIEQLSDDGLATYKFFLRSYFLNCAINPVIYGLCDVRFRLYYNEFFSRCFSRK
ncbi:muscarinic acetylcholine receptor M4-like [Dreissena polymorpha]|uniref:G-protein coupled receptors family 1 profile domain-containing protein n=1 Tax=Dreissena polymorpha TaxID=45954 RepID=A0A9D3Z4K7_DREPO|nr:muscarinic acetylcholine receptor M4-like [Dreissena polymorpha]KAH3710500.1 hypothetical protein DPMN_069984 [Dreissena polymorpha]